MINIENHRELIQYLADRGLIANKEQPVCKNLYGGVSNRTVLVCHSATDRWVIKQALEKLRVKEEWFADPERIHREAEGLRWLAELTKPGSVPGFVFEDHEQHLLAMEAIPEPHWNYKTLLMADPPVHQHSGDFADLLADIHQNSHTRREQIAPVFSDTGFFESLRLDPYYAFSARQLPEAAPFLFNLIEQTRSRKLTLVHGDYSPKNILIHNKQLVLLDHEVIHFGDPAFDLGFAMAHFLSKAHFHSSLRREFIATARHFWQTYHSKTTAAPWAKGLEHHGINNSLGCLLARVAGKSPLEYLNSSQKSVQKLIVLRLIQEEHDTMESLIHRFEELLNKHE